MDVIGGTREGGKVFRNCGFTRNEASKDGRASDSRDLLGGVGGEVDFMVEERWKRR